MSDRTAADRFRKLFVTFLTDKTTNESLKSYFEQWGEITNCYILCHPLTKKSRGFGFVTYKSAHMVDDVQAARPHYIEGKLVKTRRVVRPEDSSKPEASATVKTLFIGGIGEDIGKEDLREYFGLYGTILDIAFKERDAGKSFAFVDFDDYDTVDKIVLQDNFYKGTHLVVSKPLSCLQQAKIEMMEGLGRGGFSGDSYGGGYGRGYSDNGFLGGYGRGYSNNGFRGGYGRGYSNNGFRGGYGRGYSNNGFQGGYGTVRGGWIYYHDYISQSGRGVGRADNFRPGYRGGPVRGNTGFPQSSQDGGRRKLR